MKMAKQWFQLKYILSNTKTKYESSNHSPFINYNISKTNMTRSRLGNMFLKSRSAEDKYPPISKETIVCLSRKLRRTFTATLIIRGLLITNLFWKYNTRINIILEKDDQVTIDFHTFFSNVLPNLDIAQYIDSSANTDLV